LALNLFCKKRVFPSRVLLVAGLAALLLVACGSEEGGVLQVCRSDELGPLCLQQIEEEADFASLATEGMSGQGTKFMMPAKDDPDLLPLLFQNSQRFEYHLTFLQEVFPELYGELDASGYLVLIQRRATRDYFAGWLLAMDDPELGRIYGYSVWTDLSDPNEILQQSEMRLIHERLREAFLLEPLMYAPSDPQAVARAQAWIDPGFPVYLGRDDVDVEVYTSGVAFGRVRLMRLEQLEAALRLGELGFRDLVVVDRVPFDIEAVVAAVITGGRQWELSHVNVRMARRATPNLFVRDALGTLSDWEGQLVRLEVDRDYAGQLGRYRIYEATQEEAESWWASHRPRVEDLIAADASELRLANLLDLDGEDGRSLCARFGGKAANLALLLPLLAPAERVRAFAVPVAYFEQFMEENSIEDQRLTPPELISLRAYVQRLASDPRMVSDAAYRRELLWDLRNRISGQGRVDSALLDALCARIVDVFGGAETKVRFRSSSNVEDALEFSGAGLYDSTSVCAADSLDDDLDGPSRCDRSKAEERGVERGLRKVWSSLFSDRAWAERDWYQVDQSLPSMAILVSEAFSDEQANGVAFTGNPQVATDKRYLINAQLGDQSVVGNDSRLVPERDFLRIEDGQVSGIDRSRASTLSPPGSWVLSDTVLLQLGERMAEVVARFPIDTGSWRREQVLLDMEFKLDSAGKLRFKQIRPFLDKCRAVVCSSPPPDVCLDEQTLLQYDAWGECDAVTGACRYGQEETSCATTCEEGACL